MVEAKHNMKILKSIVCCFVIIILFITIPVSANSFSVLKEKNRNLKEIPILDSSSNDNGIVKADLKIKASGGEWVDNRLTVKTGSTIEFQVIVELSRPYIWIGALVEPPTISGESMLSVDVSSVSPKPILPFGTWKASDLEVGWGWFGIEGSSWSKTMTFKATANKIGSGKINLLVGGNYYENGQNKEGQATDSVDLTVEKKGGSKQSTPNVQQEKIKHNILDIIKTKIGLLLTKIWDVLFRITNKTGLLYYNK